MNILEMIKFDVNGLVPAVIQDEKSLGVLTLCYMNKDALEKTLTEGFIYVFRRSKGKIMKKGQTSGCVQAVKSVCLDCAGKSLLFKVDQKIAGCHEGFFTCYFRQVDKDGNVRILGERIFDPAKVYK